jgi:HK97 family phage major capsid protein
VSIVLYTTAAHKIAKIAKISTELVHDAGFDLESALAADFGREFGKTEEDACINGNGENRPYGVLHPTDGAETGVTVTGTLGFDDVMALYFSLNAEYRRYAVWLMSDETALHLRKLKENGGNYLWRDTDDTILGKPVYTSPYMPNIESGKMPVVFGDFHFYWFMERGGVMLKPLREKYAAQGVTGFIGTEFIDGRLVRREALKAITMA